MDVLIKKINKLNQELKTIDNILNANKFKLAFSDDIKNSHLDFANTDSGASLVVYNSCIAALNIYRSRVVEKLKQTAVELGQ